MPKHLGQGGRRYGGDPSWRSSPPTPDWRTRWKAGVYRAEGKKGRLRDWLPMYTADSHKNSSEERDKRDP